MILEFVHCSDWLFHPIFGRLLIKTKLDFGWFFCWFANRPKIWTSKNYRPIRKSVSFDRFSASVHAALVFGYNFYRFLLLPLLLLDTNKPKTFTNHKPAFRFKTFKLKPINVNSNNDTTVNWLTLSVYWPLIRLQLTVIRQVQ